MPQTDNGVQSGLNRKSQSGIPKASRPRTAPSRRAPTPAMIAVILFLVLGALRILILRTEDPVHTSSREIVTVRHVIDGDTFSLTDDRRVRMLGIDAPEAGFGEKVAEPYSVESTAWLRARIEGREVRLRVDDRDRDRYGRLLAWVFDSDGTLINQQSLSEGQVRLLPDFGLPLDLEASLRAAESEARLEKRGLWAMPRRRKQ